MCGEENFLEGTMKNFEKMIKVIAEPLKDLTGAKAAEEATEDARRRFEEEKATALQEKEDVKAQTAAEQLAVSRQASAIRSSGGATATGSRFSTVGGEERDFLGL